MTYMPFDIPGGGRILDRKNPWADDFEELIQAIVRGDNKAISECRSKIRVLACVNSMSEAVIPILRLLLEVKLENESDERLGPENDDVEEDLVRLRDPRIIEELLPGVVRRKLLREMWARELIKYQRRTWFARDDEVIHITLTEHGEEVAWAIG